MSPLISIQRVQNVTQQVMGCESLVGPDLIVDVKQSGIACVTFTLDPEGLECETPYRKSWTLNLLAISDLTCDVSIKV